MLSSSLTKNFARISPPSLEKKVFIAPSDATPDLRAANDNSADDSFSKTLKAMAALALVFAPQVAKAAATDIPHLETMKEESLVEQAESGLERLRDKAESLKDSIDPNGYLSERTGKVGDYDLTFKPLDMDLKPRLKSGSPALRFRGEMLETSLSRSEELDSGWTVRQGLNARLRGEASSYQESNIDLETGVFREYSGPVGESFQASFRAEAGVRQRFIGEDEGLRAGIGFRQELEGGNYQAFGHDFSLYAEGRQSAYRNFDSGETELSYQFMVGPQKNFDLSVFGKTAKISVTVGPEIKGSSTGKGFELGVESKVRARF